MKISLLILLIWAFFNTGRSFAQISYTVYERTSQGGYGSSYNPMSPFERQQRRQRLQQAREQETRRVQTERQRRQQEYDQYLQELGRQQGEASAATQRLQLENEQLIQDAERQQHLVNQFYTFRAADPNNPRSIKNWSNLRHTREQQIATQEWLNNQPANLEFRELLQKMINFSDFLVEVADEHYVNKAQELGDKTLEYAREILDTVTDFLPGVSLVKDAISFLDGTNPITGMKISDLEKTFILGSLVVPAPIKAGAKAIEKAVEVLRNITKNSPLRSKQSRDLLKTIEKSDNTVKRVLKDPPGHLGGPSQQAVDIVETVLPDISNFQNAEEILKRGKDIKVYGPMTEEGPLFREFTGINNDIPVDSTFRGGKYLEYDTTGPTILYRSSNKEKDNYGRFWSIAKPDSQRQTMIDLAHDPRWSGAPKYWTEITVPKGTKIYEGLAAPINNLPGGGSQVFLNLQDKPFPVTWIRDSGEF